MRARRARGNLLSNWVAPMAHFASTALSCSVARAISGSEGRGRLLIAAMSGYLSSPSAIASSSNLFSRLWCSSSQLSSASSSSSSSKWASNSSSTKPDMVLSVFSPTNAAQKRRASCSAVCSLAMSSASALVIAAEMAVLDRNQPRA